MFAYLSGKCGLTPNEAAFIDSVHGDGRSIKNWVNARARSAFQPCGARPFAPGAVIVKEKYAAAASGLDLIGIGLMIKRETGFAPERGDWQYAYFDPRFGLLESPEQSASCAKCHAGAAATDYVFVNGSWASMCTQTARLSGPLSSCGEPRAPQGGGGAGGGGGAAGGNNAGAGGGAGELGGGPGGAPTGGNGGAAGGGLGGELLLPQAGVAGAAGNTLGGGAGSPPLAAATSNSQDAATALATYRASARARPPR